MTYFTAEAIRRAVALLREQVHPFVGITFLACKQFDLPVGQQTTVSIDAITREFLDQHHRIVPESNFYFQPFKSIKEWVDRRYPSSGLQAINTQTFGSVFLHRRNTAKWGFDENYGPILADRLSNLGFRSRSPIFALAIWVNKFRRWPTDTRPSDVIDEFGLAFNLSSEDLSTLFYDDSDEFSGPLFRDRPLDKRELANLLPPPPDSPTQVGGTLRNMHLEFVGPAPSLSINFGERLTIVTGDNGLGKSFLLEAAWWATTGTWPDQQASPYMGEGYRPMNDVIPNIAYEIEDGLGRRSRRQSNFDWKTYSWQDDGERLTISALAVFARSDGSFAVSDPVKANFARPGSSSTEQFTQHELWNGSKLTEGLIRDWVRWERVPGQPEFRRFAEILSHLSPDDLGTLRPGPTVRLPGDPRDIPTISHKYGEAPITFASAGVQRVIGLAYLMVWAWQEHKLAAEQSGSTALDKLVIFIDELEAHLHPKWQRTVLPAILEISRPLGDGLSVQMIAATHSPMILASTETLFDDARDTIFHLSLVDGKIDLAPLDFVKYGDASSWLTSPVFGLRYARSQEAEEAIDRAKTLQAVGKADPQEVRLVADMLRKVLPPDDKFWPRWLFFAEQNGVRM